MKIDSLEAVEALISTWEGRKILVRVPLWGEIMFAFFGTLSFQMNSEDEPQFLITRSDVPSPTLVFQATDINYIMYHDGPAPQIVLKSNQKQLQNFDNNS